MSGAEHWFDDCSETRAIITPDGYADRGPGGADEHNKIQQDHRPLSQRATAKLMPWSLAALVEKLLDRAALTDEVHADPKPSECPL
jgi:hypothetical protein